MPRPVDTMQRRLLLLGAVVDCAFGLPMLLAPETAARLLAIDLPVNRAWFDLVGVLLLIVAALYLVGRSHPAVVQRAGFVAGCGRALGALILTRHALAGAGLAFGFAAVSDATFALLHLATWALASRRP